VLALRRLRGESQAIKGLLEKMLYRLGWLLHWIGSVIAVAFALLLFMELFAALSGSITDWPAFLDPFAPLGHGTLPTPPQALFFAIMAWIAGRAVRYVLSGD
jgi:hypothetical protein